MKARKASLFKKGPPGVATAMSPDEVPANFIVKASPVTSSAKQMRHLRRIYMHQGVLKAMQYMIGDIVVVRLDSPEEEDGELAALGVVFPSTSIEPNVVQMHQMLRQSHLINLGDRVRLSPYEGEVRGMRSLTVCCIDDQKPSRSQDLEWKEAIAQVLNDIRYISDGMDFECFSNGRFHAFTVLEIQGDANAQEEQTQFDGLLRGINGLHFDRRTGLGSAQDKASQSEGLPELYVFGGGSGVPLPIVEIDYKQEGRPGTSASTYASPRMSSQYARSTPMQSPAQVFPGAAPNFGGTPQQNGRPSAPAGYTPAQMATPLQQNGPPPAPSASYGRANGTKNVPVTSPPPSSGARRASVKRSSVGSAGRRASSMTAGKFEEIDSDEEERIVEEQQLPKVRYESIGGLANQIKSLREVVELPLLYPTLFSDHFHIPPPRGVLLYGPPGTGKTMLLRAIATETSAKVYTISGPSIVSKYMGEAEEKLRSIWSAAQKDGPAIIFIDEVDAIAPRRDADAGEAESRIVASLLTLMDGIDSSAKVVVIAATNRPNVIDPALRRPGRFDREIEVGIPDANARREILTIQLEEIPNTFTPDFVAEVAGKTHGFVGADLSAVCRESVILAITRSLRDKVLAAEMVVTERDMHDALPLVRPSAMREIFLETPHTRWTDVGGQDRVKQRLKEAVEWPLTHPDAFERLGVKPAKGVLLYGPPGCSKTLVARALATESGLNFIAVKGPELFNKYVGEAERSLREVFKKARAASPSVIFFDELDAISGSRGGGGGGAGGGGDGATEGASDRLLTTLLNEMDGIEDLQNVTVLAATNRPDTIDPALLRPGRLDRLLYVAPPDLDARRAILDIQLRRMSLADDVDRLLLAEATEGCSGAEVVAVCRDAGLTAMREDIHALAVAQRHFAHVLANLKRNITPEVLLFFEDFALRMGDTE